MAGGSDRQPTADECIRAGMYWFGRSDFEAARAWWERAIQLDPANSRAQECLRLLDRTASVGFKSEVLAAETPLPSVVSPTPPAGVARPDWSQLRGSIGEENDAFEFAADAQREEAEAMTSQDLPPVASEGSAWDEGPSTTPAITLHPPKSYDALAEATPLPDADKGRFFGREYVGSEDEIRSFLEATGDLVPPEPGHLPWPKELSTEVAVPPIGAAKSDISDIVFDEPVEEKSDGLTPARPMTAERALEEASRRLQLHDFNGVLELVESIPKDAQGDEARRLIAEARRNLTKMFESKIGDFERVPRVQISEEEVIWLNLNHRAGFVLSQIDGTVSFEDLLALSGMPRLDTLRVLADLLDKNVIA